MLKVFISQPMRGRTDEEILKQREQAIEYITEQYPSERIEILQSYFDDEETNPLKLLARSLYVLADADVVCFCPGWTQARGCRVEYDCAKEYDIERILIKRK